MDGKDERGRFLPGNTYNPDGKAPHQPTEELRAKVLALAQCGVPFYVIAQDIGIAKGTLTKHYRDELDDGAANANERVTHTAFNLAVSGEVPAMTMFWLKTQCGWRETSNLDVTSGGKPIGKAILGVDVDDAI